MFCYFYAKCLVDDSLVGTCVTVSHMYVLLSYCLCHFTGVGEMASCRQHSFFILLQWVHRWIVFNFKIMLQKLEIWMEGLATANRRFKAVQGWKRWEDRKIQLTSKEVRRKLQEKVYSRRNWLIYNVKVI